jgi:hypothetical protein
MFLTSTLEKWTEMFPDMYYPLDRRLGSHAESICNGNLGKVKKQILALNSLTVHTGELKECLLNTVSLRAI